MTLLHFPIVFIVLACFFYGVHRAEVWAERDALRRGRSPTFVKYAVILFFPIGLIFWLVFRPDILDENSSSSRSF